MASRFFISSAKNVNRRPREFQQENQVRARRIGGKGGFDYSIVDSPNPEYRKGGGRWPIVNPNNASSELLAIQHEGVCGINILS
jgi:hypothetical protein